jgi:DNA-binding CsgD family transcriptional regulator
MELLLVEWDADARLGLLSDAAAIPSTICATARSVHRDDGGWNRLRVAHRRGSADHEPVAGHDDLAVGRAALAAGQWATAAEVFTAALARAETGEALDGLGRAFWWSDRVAEGIELRTRAYAAFHREQGWESAARVAVWLAREHRALFRNAAVAAGWLARATAAADHVPDTSAAGWVALGRAELAADPATARADAEHAAAIAGDHHDSDLEIVALARLGLILVAAGEVDAALAHLDEAMAAATAGVGRDPQSIGDACCALMEAADLLGDQERVRQWGAAVEQYRAAYGDNRLVSVDGHATLSSFCGACCGGISMVRGRLDEAEDELVAAIATLQESGMHSRCVHPATQLAELWSVQGRVDAAQHLLDAYADLPETVRPLALIDLAVGAPNTARVRLSHRIAELEGQDVVALPLWIVLVDAELACGDLAAAARAAGEVRRIAALTQSLRHDGEALFAAGKVAAAQSDPEAAALLGAAARRFSEAVTALPACRARLARARVLAGSDRGGAVADARAALAAFERLGASRDADEAAAFLRGLGVRGRTGPKDLGQLTRRELEVLRLVSEGLSNAEIAQRLFISVKTAGHHVSNILAKLGLRSRTEAAAYAALNLARTPVEK